MASVRTDEDVVFRETPERDLETDLYLPDGGDERPAVIFVHGGGWESDHRGMFGDHLTALAERGYVGADVTHRLSGEAEFPAAIEDVKYGIRWLKSHADEYGVDPECVAIGGHSSGAHLAALAAVSPDHPELEPDGLSGVSSSVAAAVLMNGPYNLQKLGQLDPAHLFISGFVRRLFGAEYLDRPRAYERASCGTHIDGSEPPVLAMTSTNDEEVPFRESVQLRDRLERAGVVVDLSIADGGDHLCYTANGTHYERGLKRIVAFLDEHVRET